MAVVARKRKGFTTFYAVNEWLGKQVAEPVGRNRRDAETRDRAMKREIAAGTYRPPGETKSVTIGQYATAWGAARTNAYGSDERGVIRKHIASAVELAALRLDEATPTHVARWVADLKRKPGRKGRAMSDKTIANVVGVLHQVFEQAIREDRCSRNPVNLAPGTLRRRPKDEVEPYTVAEAVVLTRHQAIPWPIRVLNALGLFAGLRKGEACGRRWRDLDDAPRPLPSMTVKSQYEGQKLKTDRYRVVPLHPELQVVLAAWAELGFELYTGRKPTPDDFIVPNASARAKAPMHTESSYYKLFCRTAPLAGVTPRTVHATRHTFISLCRRGGARSDVLERVTHNAAGQIIDRYTHFDWAPLCEAVSCLRLDARPELHPVGGNGGNQGSPQTCSQAPRLLDSSNSEASASASIPDASTLEQQENSGELKPRQDARQELEGDAAALRLALEARAALHGGRPAPGELIPVLSVSESRKGERDVG